NAAPRIRPEIFGRSLRRTKIDLDSLNVFDRGAWPESRRQASIDEKCGRAPVSRARGFHPAGEADTVGPDAPHGLQEVRKVDRTPRLDLGPGQKLSAMGGTPAVEILEPPSYGRSIPFD